MRIKKLIKVLKAVEKEFGNVKIRSGWDLRNPKPKHFRLYKEERTLYLP